MQSFFFVPRSAKTPLTIVSSGRRFGDPGFYFTVQDPEGTVRARYVRTMREKIRVYADGNGAVRADHTLAIGARYSSVYTTNVPAGSRQRPVKTECKSRRADYTSTVSSCLRTNQSSVGAESVSVPDHIFWSVFEKEAAVPKYLLQANYLGDGIKGLLKEGGTNRRAAARRVC